MLGSEKAMAKKDLKIAVIGGDGVGPHVTEQALRVLEAVAKMSSVGFVFEFFPFSADEYLRTKRTLTNQDLTRFRKEFDAILFGALGDPRIPDNIHAREILLGLRFELDLYVNFRPVKLLDSKLCPLKNKMENDIRFVIFRENTEGNYRHIGGVVRRETNDEVAIETSVDTYLGVERIVRAACQYAKDKGLRRVCMVDKSNVLRFGHDLWQRVWKKTEQEYVTLEFSHLYVDAAAMEMVRAPEQFDVIVTSNMFGDILSDLGAQLQGGMGMAASINYHPGKAALFEPVHGSAPNLVGKGVANPMASILTAALLLEFFGYQDEAKKVEAAVKAAIQRGVTTPDLGGKTSTEEVATFIVSQLEEISERI